MPLPGHVRKVEVWGGVVWGVLCCVVLCCVCGVEEGEEGWWLVGLGWVGLGWVGLGWVGLGWVGLGWVGLGWGGVGWGGWGVRRIDMQQQHHVSNRYSSDLETQISMLMNTTNHHA